MSRLDKLNIDYKENDKDIANGHTIISYHIEGGLIQTLDSDMHALLDEKREELKAILILWLTNPDNYKRK